MQFDIKEVAQSLVDQAKSRGMQADVLVVSSEGSSVQYRMLSLEEVQRFSNCNVMLRVLKGNKQSVVSTNDVNSLQSVLDRVELMVESATNDDCACMPPASMLAKPPIKASLYDPTILSIHEMRRRAEILEGYALSYPGIVNSEGASFSQVVHDYAFSSTEGSCVGYKKSAFSCALCIVAKSEKDNSMENWHDYSTAVREQDLVSSEVLAAKVSEMAVKLLNPVKIQSAKMPVVFSSRASSLLLDELVAAFKGTAIYNESSFLCGLLGKKLFSDKLNIIDNPKATNGCASLPFDGEGVETCNTLLVRDGVINDWLLDGYTAKKLALQTNGKCIRSAGGRLSPGYSNLYIDAGCAEENDLLKNIKRGLYVTSTMGMGVNYVTGDYSKGAQGFLIEDGKISYPVSEITVAGNLKSMFSECVPCANLNFEHRVNSPTLYLGDMMIAGT